MMVPCQCLDHDPEKVRREPIPLKLQAAAFTVSLVAARDLFVLVVKIRKSAVDFALPELKAHGFGVGLTPRAIEVIYEVLVTLR